MSPEGVGPKGVKGVCVAGGDRGYDQGRPRARHPPPHVNRMNDRQV